MKKMLKAIFIVLISSYMNFYVSNNFAYNGLTEPDKKNIVELFKTAFSTSGEIEIDRDSTYLAVLIRGARSPSEYRDIYEFLSHSALAALRDIDVINAVIKRIPELAPHLLQIAQNNRIANRATYMEVMTAFGNLGDLNRLEIIFNQIEAQANTKIYAAYIRAIGISSFQKAQDMFYKAITKFEKEETQIIERAFAWVIADHYHDNFEEVIRAHGITFTLDTEAMANIAMHAFIQAGNFINLKKLFNKFHKNKIHNLKNNNFFDLHRYSFPETWVILSELLERAYASKEKYIMLIPGQGIHSDHGSAVIHAINVFTERLSAILGQKVLINPVEFNPGRIRIVLPANFPTYDIRQIIQKIASVKFKYNPTTQPRWQPNLPNDIPNIQPTLKKNKHKKSKTYTLQYGQTLLETGGGGTCVIKTNNLAPPKQNQLQSQNSAINTKKSHQIPPPKSNNKEKNTEQAKKKKEDEFLDQVHKQSYQDRLTGMEQTYQIKNGQKFSEFFANNLNNPEDYWPDEIITKYLKVIRISSVICDNEDLNKKVINKLLERISLGQKISDELITETIIFLSKNSQQWDTLAKIFEKLIITSDEYEAKQKLKKIFDNILLQAPDILDIKDSIFGVAIFIATRFPKYVDILAEYVDILINNLPQEQKEQKKNLFSPLIAILIKVCAINGNIKQALNLVQCALNNNILNLTGLYNALNLCLEYGLFHYASANLVTREVIRTTNALSCDFPKNYSTYNMILYFYELQDQ